MPLVEVREVEGEELYWTLIGKIMAVVLFSLLISEICFS